MTSALATLQYSWSSVNGSKNSIPRRRSLGRDIIYDLRDRKECRTAEKNIYAVLSKEWDGSARRSPHDNWSAAKVEQPTATVSLWSP